MNLEKNIINYLDYCKYQKNLNSKTLKAYHIDLFQFLDYTKSGDMKITRNDISSYITVLHQKYKPKSSKRKIASIKAFFNYLEYEELLKINPFSKLKTKSQEPFLFPRTISTQSLQRFFNTLYLTHENEFVSLYQQKTLSRDRAVLELLFATGLRVSELCTLQQENINLEEGRIKIYGKGSKERIVHLTNKTVLNALSRYQDYFNDLLSSSSYFFINRLGNPLSEQSVRFMIAKYSKKANISEHITPHMFRHTFATMLLEEDVDIRYIQHILGHSSITTTQIYTHVSSTKQREILTIKHPRNRIL